jgi:hypothetical protein
MKTHVRTILFCAALIVSAAVAVSPVYAQQTNSGKPQGSSGGGKPGVVRQEFGPQVAAKRGDRMGVVGNPNQGKGNASASPSPAAANSATRAKQTKHVSHENSTRPAKSHRSH